jgi:hypothetical protein
LSPTEEKIVKKLSIFVWALFVTTAATAAFPSRVTVHLKAKMSCRDVKKMLRPSRLYVHCQTNTVRADAYAADYFGLEPLDKLFTAFSGHEKVESISAGEDIRDVLAPVESSIY